MYFKLASTTDDEIGFTFLRVVVLIVLSPSLIALLIEKFKFDMTIATIIISAIVIISSVFLVLIAKNQNKQAWPMNLEVNDKNKKLTIIYSKYNNQNKTQILDFDEIDNIEIKIIKSDKRLFVNVIIKTKKQQYIIYKYNKNMLNLSKLIVYLNRYFKVTYSNESEQYVEKWLNNYYTKGTFEYPATRKIYDFLVFNKFFIITVIMTAIMVSTIVFEGSISSVILKLAGLQSH